MEILFILGIVILSLFSGAKSHTIEDLPVGINKENYFDKTAFTEIYYMDR